MLKNDKKKIMAMVWAVIAIIISIGICVVATQGLKDKKPASGKPATGTDMATGTDVATDSDTEQETTTIQQETVTAPTGQPAETTQQQTTQTETSESETTTPPPTKKPQETTKNSASGTTTQKYPQETTKVTSFGYVSFQTEVMTKQEIYNALPKAFIEVDYTPPAGVKYPYAIKVNRAQCCITIYGIDSKGEYSVPVKAMVCSVAKTITGTPLGTFHTTDMYKWRLMQGNVYSQYATRFTGHILFHSVPYYTQNKNDLETHHFNKLGNPASAGCVRLCVADAKWIQENCPKGTQVTVYSDSVVAGPLGKPTMIRIPTTGKNKGWDPTDPDSKNPWNSCMPVIKITNSVIQVNQGAKVTTAQLFTGVTATDTCGNDITDRIRINNIQLVKNTGSLRTLEVTYFVVDLLGREATATKTVNVTITQEIQPPTTPQKPIAPQPTTPQPTTPETTTPQPTTPQPTTTPAEQPTETTTPESTTPSAEQPTTEQGEDSAGEEEELSGEDYRMNE